MRLDTGYFKMPRRWVESIMSCRGDVIAPRLATLTYVLHKAYFRDGKCVKAGSFPLNKDDFCRATGMSSRQADRHLAWFAEKGLLKRERVGAQSMRAMGIEAESGSVILISDPRVYELVVEQEEIADQKSGHGFGENMTTYRGEEKRENKEGESESTASLDLFGDQLDAQDQNATLDERREAAFEIFVRRYPYRRRKRQALELWRELTDADRLAAIIGVDLYEKRNRQIAERMNDTAKFKPLDGFLRARVWEDLIDANRLESARFQLAARDWIENVGEPADPEPQATKVEIGKPETYPLPHKDSARYATDEEVQKHGNGVPFYGFDGLFYRLTASTKNGKMMRVACQPPDEHAAKDAEVIEAYGVKGILKAANGDGEFWRKYLC